MLAQLFGEEFHRVELSEVEHQVRCAFLRPVKLVESVYYALNSRLFELLSELVLIDSSCISLLCLLQFRTLLRGS